MTLDALRDIDFLTFKNERTNVRNALLRAHEPGFPLDLTRPGYVVTSQLRLLSAVTAVVLRHTDVGIGTLRSQGLPAEAVDAGLDDLAGASDPFDKQFPFFQRPAIPAKSAKDSARRLGPGDHPVKKLSPSMPPDEAEEYWDLNSTAPDSLAIEDAILELVVFHYLSMAGNNAYDGNKCQMGAPAIRWVGADYAATELCVFRETLLDTLLGQIPKNWVEGTGLPAWADRRCERSLTEVSGRPDVHPLWAATWSSNAPACYWEEDHSLSGVRTGGIPESWYVSSVMGKTEESRKGWWKERNLHDPFYLYMPDGNNELKPQRLDFGVDGTQLAVQWAAENKTGAVRNNLDDRVLAAPEEILQLMFARHQLGAKASSGTILASELFVPSLELWAFDLDEEVLDLIQEEATRVQALHSALTRVFRRKGSNETGAAIVLDDLTDRRDDASNAFWRHITGVYEEILAQVRDFTNKPQQGDDREQAGASGEEKLATLLTELHTRAVEATLAAFDEVVSPHALQEPARIAYVRGRLRPLLHARVKDTLSKN